MILTLALHEVGRADLLTGNGKMGRRQEVFIEQEQGEENRNIWLAEVTQSTFVG